MASIWLNLEEEFSTFMDGRVSSGSNYMSDATKRLNCNDKHRLSIKIYQNLEVPQLYSTLSLYTYYSGHMKNIFLKIKYKQCNCLSNVICLKCVLFLIKRKFRNLFTWNYLLQILSVFHSKHNLNYFLFLLKSCKYRKICCFPTKIIITRL